MSFKLDNISTYQDVMVDLWEAILGSIVAKIVIRFVFKIFFENHQDR